MRPARRFAAAALFALAGALAAGCGGGGGGAGPQRAEVPTDPADPPERQEPAPEPNPTPDPEPTPEPEPEPTPDPFSDLTPDPTPAPAPPAPQVLTAEVRDELARIRGLNPTENLSAISVRAAYQNVVRARNAVVPFGDGVTIGIIDTGIEPCHSAFVDGARPGDCRFASTGGARSVTEEILEVGAGDPASDFVSASPDGTYPSSHGTAVASVAAGAARGVQVREETESGTKVSIRLGQGVAPGANIRMFAIQLGSGGGDYREIDLDGMGSFSNEFGGYLSTALSRGVDVLNMSLSVTGIIDHYSAEDLQSRMTTLVAAAAQSGVADKTILVWAAGNMNGRVCSDGRACNIEEGESNGAVDARSVAVSSGLPVRFPELRGHWVAAVAVDPDGVIASYSNRCGIAADFCIAAPGGGDMRGTGVPVAYFGYYFDEDRGIDGPVYGEGFSAGTSLAAPTVAGGLAVMKQIFRGQLSSAALVSRLFATADKTGRYADEDIYGQGMMNLGAATAPVGAMTVAGGAAVAAGGAGLRETGLALGRAFGDGLAASLAGREIAAFDQLGAPFWFDLGGLVGAARGPSPADRLRQLTAPPGLHGAARRSGEDRHRPALAGAAVPGPGRLRAGLLEVPAGAAAGHLALAGSGPAATLDFGGGLAATAFTGRGDLPRVSGSALSWRSSRAPLGLTAGWLTEREELLGTRAGGAFGGFSADTGFAGVETGFALGPWRVAAAAQIGAVTPHYRRALVADMQPLTTTAFAAHATRRLAGGDTVRFSLAQPLRVERGRAVLSVPVGRTQDGGVLRRRIAARLEPSGRQIDMAAHWRRTLRRAGEIGLGVGWTLDPNHVAGARPDVTFAAGWRLAF